MERDKRLEDPAFNDLIPADPLATEEKKVEEDNELLPENAKKAEAEERARQEAIAKREEELIQNEKNKEDFAEDETFDWSIPKAREDALNLKWKLEFEEGEKRRQIKDRVEEYRKEAIKNAEVDAEAKAKRLEIRLLKDKGLL